MHQDQQKIFTIRTLACDICERFDSLLISADELQERVNRNSLQIGSRILSHGDHLRIVYFDIDGKYLGDTMSLNISNKPLRKSADNIPHLLEEYNDESFSLARKMLKFLRRKSYTISIIGPSFAGKTSLTVYLETGVPERTSQRVNHAPTMGQSVKRFELANNQLTIFDMGGQEDFWHLWGDKINQSDKIIFVLDGTANNLNVSKKALSLLFEEITASVDILIMFNKIDLYLDNYSEIFAEPHELLSSLTIPANFNYWIVQSSVYNGYAYRQDTEEQYPLSTSLTEFFER